jgi:Concanavalin A-like lectin/glucanases superfamily
MQESMLAAKKKGWDNHDLLLHLDTDFAAVGGQSITVNGTPSITSSLTHFGKSVALFKATDFLSFTSLDAEADYTIDLWMNLTGVNSNGTMTLYTPSPDTQHYVDWPTAGNIAAHWTYDNSRPTSPAGLFTRNTWNHFAWVRFGLQFYGYINGTRVLSTTLTQAPAIPFNQAFGPSGWGPIGYVSEYAFKKVAKWTGANFPVPTAPYVS